MGDYVEEEIGEHILSDPDDGIDDGAADEPSLTSPEEDDDDDFYDQSLSEPNEDSTTTTSTLEISEQYDTDFFKENFTDPVETEEQNRSDPIDFNENDCLVIEQKTKEQCKGQRAECWSAGKIGLVLAL